MRLIYLNLKHNRVSMSKHLIIIFFSLINIFILQAQPSDTLSFKESFAVGLENNYGIRVARNQNEVMDNNVSLGNAGFLPKIDASAAYSGSVNDARLEFLNDETVEREGARASSFTAGASLNWTLFDGLNMFVTYSQLKTLQNQGELSVRLTIEDFFFNLASVYYNIIQQQHLLEAATQTALLSDDRLRVTNEKLVLGAAGRYDVLQAQVALNADSSRLLLQEENLKRAKIQLNQMLSRQPMTAFMVEDSIPLFPMVAYDSLISAALSNNTELLMAQNNTLLSQQDLSLVKGRRLPEITANLGYQYNNSTSEAGFVKENTNIGFNYGVTARVTLFDGFNQHRQVQNAQILQQNSMLQVAEKEEEIRAELAIAYLVYQHALRLVLFEEKSVRVAQQNLGIALERYRLGNLSGLEMREVQNDFMGAASRLITTRYQAKMAEVALLRLTGQLLPEVNQ